MTTDFHAWGNNCRLLGISEDAVMRIVIEQYRKYFEQNMNSSDEFWIGYHYGTATQIVSIY